jgi:hypothetical protein
MEQRRDHFVIGVGTFADDRPGKPTYPKQLQTSVFLVDNVDNPVLCREVLCVQELPQAFCDGQRQFIITCFNMGIFNAHLHKSPRTLRDLPDRRFYGWISGIVLQRRRPTPAGAVEQFVISGTQRLIVSNAIQ